MIANRKHRCLKAQFLTGFLYALITCFLQYQVLIYYCGAFIHTYHLLPAISSTNILILCFYTHLSLASCNIKYQYTNVMLLYPLITCFLQYQVTTYFWATAWDGLVAAAFSFLFYLTYILGVIRWLRQKETCFPNCCRQVFKIK